MICNLCTHDLYNSLCECCIRMTRRRVEKRKGVGERKGGVEGKDRGEEGGKIAIETHKHTRTRDSCTRSVSMAIVKIDTQKTNE